MTTTITLTSDEYAALLAERQSWLADQQLVHMLTQQLRVVTVERDLLKQRVDAFLRQLFAAKSEARANPAQRDLFINEAEALAPTGQPVAEESIPDTEVQIAPHSRKKRGRKPLDPYLPREIVRHELPESERVCAHDGSPLVEIGAEISEQLDIIPQQVRVIQHQRIKYACPCCDDSIRVTPAPVRIIPKGLLTEAALAWVITGKYQDGLPLYRQAALLSRFGGDLSRSTLAASVVRVGHALQPLINLLRDRLLEADVIHGDETVVQVLKEPGRAAQTKSYLWVQMTDSGPPIRLFSYTPGRGRSQAQPLYEGIKPGSVLMSDGYEVYNGLAAGHGLIHLGCWAHARRYFVEAEAAQPKPARVSEPLATRFITAIGQLYAIESRTKDASPEQRLQFRQTHSREILANIETLLLQHLHGVMPNSLLGKALHYLSAQWPKLIRFVENGRWPIDNNACENAIRPFVIGRRNWLFSDTVGGAQASASLYSLIETCKANSIEPYGYLIAVFRQLPLAKTAEDFEALLPWQLTPSVIR
ncbi:Mobile element protein [Methylomonas albis]|jgi:transposase|uniref:IS66 family transposase n=1 Tax=Methylomonas albis TaxID=1854563 RepID=A0ABR9CVK1_9GAMM|nr:IS66 family transposase [Methylomonas albis]MBD9354841.1 IS66 family transposase [Methylomonas albis]MBD9355962.1 IS66 family transposase [Methylomonas albis]MBD9357819.1 IS66 family transposase [Methylomonas albis]MBD9358722.1 IS66 family transposase [Methylomonas albis]CAD6877750.1 Mobile element protein [Methylomonas albis]